MTAPLIERVRNLESIALQGMQKYETIDTALAELVEQGRNHAAAISALAVDHRDYRQEVTQALQELRAETRSTKAIVTLIASHLGIPLPDQEESPDAGDQP